LTACFHPHLTTIVEGPEQLEKLMKLSKIAFCPDTAHLAAGGGDPAELIRTYPDRVRHVHLKDFQKDPFAFLPLGKGELNFTDIFSALKEIDYQGWAVVELDGYDGDPKEAAAISMKFIQENLG
jgi:inosose dehydratase